MINLAHIIRYPLSPVINYVGTGDASTPKHVVALMASIAKEMNLHGAVLRTGGDEGPDAAFLRKAAHAEVFLPWDGFNDHSAARSSDAVNYVAIESYPLSLRMQLAKKAEKHHPAWDRCKPAAKLMHMRSVLQIIGADLVNVANFIITYSGDGAVSGSTAQTMRVAEAYNVPVFNLHSASTAQEISAALGITAEGFR